MPTLIDHKEDGSDGLLAVALDRTVAVAVVEAAFVLRTSSWEYKTCLRHFLRSPVEVLTRRSVIFLSLANVLFNSLPSSCNTALITFFKSKQRDYLSVESKLPGCTGECIGFLLTHRAAL